MVLSPETVGKMMPDVYKKVEDEMVPLDGVLLPESIADQYWMLHKQPRNAWTFDLDLRPWSGSAWFNS